MLKRSIINTTLVASALLGAATAAYAVPAVGVVAGNALFAFDTATPGTSGTSRTINGLAGGETLYGIDFRPATGALYGLGTTGTLYTIDPTTAAASVASRLSVGLTGTSFDISFNPTVDRLRIVSNTGQNLRVDVSSGAATVDGMLAYAAGDPNAARTPAVVGAAYTNQVAGATATVLYDLDSATNALTTQAPPNNGTLNTTASLSATNLISFDIDPNGNVGYAASPSTLYRLNLTTGTATALGTFASANVTDFAISPQAVAEPITVTLLGGGLVALALTRRRRLVTAAA